MPPDPQNHEPAPLPPEPAAAVSPPAAAVLPSADAVPAATVAPASPAEAVTPVADVKPEQKPEAKAAPEIPAPQPTLLEKTEKPAEAKPADKPAEPKPEAKADGKSEDKPAEPAKLEPVEYEYKLPDTLTMSDEQKGEFHKAADAFRADPQKGIQALVDLHAKTMQQYAENLATNTLADQHKAFAEVRKGWRTKLQADPELGGAGFATTQGAIARMRDLLVSTAKEGSEKYNQDWADWNAFNQATGAGDHPALHRLLHNIARWLDEPPVPPSGAVPPKGNGKNPRRSGLYSEQSRDKMNV